MHSVLSTQSSALKLIAAVVLLLSSWSLAYGQKTTERFIPIGKSPGLSGRSTLLGTVEAVDPKKMTLTCANSHGRSVVKVTNQTRLWLDRTQLKQTNQTGTLSDCQKGCAVEVKFADKERKSAEWIKVEVARP